MKQILFASDTETKPTPAMRQAIANAEVGDEQKGQDPTVNKLLDRAAELLGKEAALFLPGGTMCNYIAVKVQTRPADVIFADHMAHIIRAESGGVAFSSGVMVEPVNSGRGVFTPEALEAAIHKAATVPSPYSPIPKLVCLEQTHNFGYGSVWSLEEMKAVAGVARRHGLYVHIDGARLMNAVVASGTPAKDFCALADSVWIDFTKGLGAPVGAVLAGSAAFIQEARRHKHFFGGAMRQAGIIAAGCLYALDFHVDRLAEDHANAQYLAKKLGEMETVKVANPNPASNMVFFEINHPNITNATALNELSKAGISLGSVGNQIRAVAHLDVTREDVERTVQALRGILK